MKRWMVIALCVVGVVFLAVRGVYVLVHRSQSEREWYVSQLNFNFSARIDSVKLFDKQRGVVYFSIRQGDADLAREKRLGKKLKHNEHLRFMFPRSNKTAIIFNQAYLIQTGDSLLVSSKIDLISVLRNNKKIVESKMEPSLTGRPF